MINQENDLSYWDDTKQTIALINVISMSIAMISFIYMQPIWFVTIFVMISAITTCIRFGFFLMWLNNKIFALKEKLKIVIKKRGEKRDSRRKERKKKEEERSSTHKDATEEADKGKAV